MVIVMGDVCGDKNGGYSCSLPPGHASSHEAYVDDRVTGEPLYAWARLRLSEMSTATSPKVKRVPVNFRYDCLNPTFIKMLAKIGHYAAEKYGSWEQYANARLIGEKSCVNHIYEHLRQYVEGEPHDKFGDTRWHLAAIAYNAMMAFLYDSKFGREEHPLANCGKELIADVEGK